MKVQEDPKVEEEEEEEEEVVLLQCSEAQQKSLRTYQYSVADAHLQSSLDHPDLPLF
jgi:hypothetical protein